MTETEYVNATNLARLRIAKLILCECTPGDEHTMRRSNNAATIISREIKRLEEHVTVDWIPLDEPPR